MWHLIRKGEQAGQKTVGSLQRESSCHFLILSHFLVKKIYNKSVSRSNFGFINHRACTIF